jgi:hypothetical protein
MITFSGIWIGARNIYRGHNIIFVTSSYILAGYLRKLRATSSTVHVHALSIALPRVSRLTVRVMHPALVKLPPIQNIDLSVLSSGLLGPVGF